MAETLLFDIPTPIANEEAVSLIHWWQSLDGNIWDAAIDSIQVANLPTDVATGKKRWASLVADPAKFHQLRSESASGTVAITGEVIPPRTATVLCEIYADLRDFGLHPLSGVNFLLTPKTISVFRMVISQIPNNTQTDSDGKVRMYVAMGGTYIVSSSAMKVPVTIDTTGKHFINIADYFI